MKRLLAFCCWLGVGLGLSVLSACGGGDFAPQVTGVNAQSLQYSRTARILVGGMDLRSSMVADLGPGCPSPTLSTGSSTTLAVLNCTVTAVGELPLTIRSANGQLLYEGRLNVPLPQVQLTTSLGSMTLELDPVAAPVTVNNFLGYVNGGFYKDTLFHRVIDGFVVQGGGFTTGMVLKSGLKDPIALESNNGLRNLRATVAMARTDEPASATSQFFINLVDNAFLDDQDAGRPGYAVFGRVVKGMEVADVMAKEPTGTVGVHKDVPTTDVLILQATQVK